MLVGVDCAVFVLSSFAGVLVGVVGDVSARVMLVVAMVSCVNSAYIVLSCVSGVSVNWEKESDARSSWSMLPLFMVSFSFNLWKISRSELVFSVLLSVAVVSVGVGTILVSSSLVIF